ncbi:unnamed protein product [Trifolium pratense]|uniref:Uncharacterized protein n=1 Tax=Trifolium pratense TaxID=57577 RepID=A0ACB0JFW0_TRIPR|nr:unnamed protein product [Trifolium pratense]
MGCNASKLDRLPAVSLCRDRCKFIDESLRQSYTLADSHLAHMDSLRTLGPALLCFFQQFEDSGETIPSISKSPPPPRSQSSSSSDSDEGKFVLHCESESEDSEKESQLFTHTDYIHHDSVISSVPDNVTFMTYVKPIYDSYSPTTNAGVFSGFKPPSPPPPSNSAWDFLNFFEPYEKYQVPYCDGGDGYADTNVTVENEKGKVNGHVICENVPFKSNGGGVNVSKVENGEVKDNEADLKKESLVLEKKLPELKESVKGFSDAVKEIQILFERASDSGSVLLEMLDVGKLRYHSKIELNPVSCKIMHVFTPSNPLTVKCVESPLLGLRTGSKCEGVYMEKGLSSANLSSTLSKLCMWEKKLYHEVKAEEKLRMLHQKKCKQLKRMNKKEADVQKIDSVKAFIGILVTKMKMSIKVVDKISNTISKLTEEELWPQINRFILMFLGMWKDMQECYKLQCQEIVNNETKALSVSSFNRKPCSANIAAAIELKSELQKWSLSFLDWIQAQKSQVKGLNDWLVRCLMYEPEEIPDDSTPVGAPPVFVICNKWSRAVDNISEMNVIEAVNGFTLRVNELLEKHILELQKNSTLDNELEKKVKNLERQEQKMHKMMKVRERKMDPSAKNLREGVAVHNDDVKVDSITLQSDLKHIFLAMEKFSATTASLYEELSQQIKQDDPVLGEFNKNN